jgi:hypothetical protein
MLRAILEEPKKGPVAKAKQHANTIALLEAACGRRARLPYRCRKVSAPS